MLLLYFLFSLPGSLIWVLVQLLSLDSTFFMAIFLNTRVLSWNFIFYSWTPAFFSHIYLPVTPCVSPVTDSSGVICYQPMKASVSGTSFLFCQIHLAFQEWLIDSYCAQRVPLPEIYKKYSPCLEILPSLVDSQEMLHSRTFWEAAKASRIIGPEVWGSYHTIGQILTNMKQKKQLRR